MNELKTIIKFKGSSIFLSGIEHFTINYNIFLFGATFFINYKL